MIYEGTNGIQAMDLLARKTVMDGGKSMMADGGRNAGHGRPRQGTEA
jgi:hypothetical protein